MFASQLLRILQTLPRNVDHETCAFDSAGLEEIMKENQNGVVSDLNNCENNASQLLSEINDKDEFWNTPELEYTTVVEDFTNGNENEAQDSVIPSTIPSSKMKLFERNIYADKNGNENEFGDSVAPFTIPSGKKELFERNTDLYTDKNVMQCELPELIVCHKDSTYHVVKDICIDEGVPFDKILIESDNDKGLCTVLHSDENRNGGMTKESEDIEFLSPDGSKSSLENDHDEDDAHECGTKEQVGVELLIADALKSLLESHSDDDISYDGGSLAPVQAAGEANHDPTETIMDDVSREKFVMSSMPLLQNISTQISLKSLFESPDCEGNEVEQQSGQIPCSEAKCESPDVVSAAEELNQRSPVAVHDLPYNNSKVESATITFDFNSSKSAASGRDDNPDDVDPEQPLKIDSEPCHEDVMSDSLADGSEVQHDGQGESSFAMAGPVSGLITYSGPMIYSGSVSLRSDSSTTSARSFAFPILQSEWNSSPVRMAKADRRHRGWRLGRLCCKF